MSFHYSRLIATAFIPFGQLVGWYLENAPKGVAAYSVNVLASLAGIAGFTLLCFLNQSPWVWFLVAGILCSAYFWRDAKARKVLAIGFLVCVALLALPEDRNAKTYWSPYQKLTIVPLYDGNQLVTYALITNSSLYQKIVDLSPEFVQAHAAVFHEHPLDQNSYNMPYRFYPSPPSVLVLGSGMGNDVAAALRNGAGHVEAVEIDPLILQLGKQLHFEHPYQSPRVHVVVNDARNYIENSHEKFDLIVFSLLDSHTTTSHFTNIRIDNYVYTREALARAKQLLKPDGLFVVKFQVETPWIAGRLYALMQATFAQKPIQFQGDIGGYDMSGRFFVAGSPERLAKATSDPSLAAYLASHGNLPMQAAMPTTDDWPYFYQHAPGLPIIVILVSLAVLIVFGWFLRQASGEGEGSIDLHFMFLGAGFMLLEAQIVSKMALLFGTTWVVNAVVVSGLLCLIVAANLGLRRFAAHSAAGCLCRTVCCAGSHVCGSSREPVLRVLDSTSAGRDAGPLYTRVFRRHHLHFQLCPGRLPWKRPRIESLWGLARRFAGVFVYVVRTEVPDHSRGPAVPRLRHLSGTTHSTEVKPVSGRAEPGVAE